MGKLITNHQPGLGQQLRLGNGSALALLSMLLLSGMELAVTDWEHDLLAWLGEHAWSGFGRGVTSLDLDEVAWDLDRFSDQQAFVLRMIDRALVRCRWERLVEERPQLSDALRGLRGLVERYRPEFVQTGAT